MHITTHREMTPFAWENLSPTSSEILRQRKCLINSMKKHVRPFLEQYVYSIRPFPHRDRFYVCEREREKRLGVFNQSLAAVLLEILSIAAAIETIFVRVPITFVLNPSDENIECDVLSFNQQNDCSMHVSRSSRKETSFFIWQHVCRADTHSWTCW